MKTKKVAIGARVPEFIFDGIVELEEREGIQRTNAITLLLEKGLYSTDNGKVEESPLRAARKMAEQLTNHKKSAEEWKAKYMKLVDQQKSDVNSHPFVQTLLSEGVQFNLTDKTITVKNLTQLFDFLNKSI